MSILPTGRFAGGRITGQKSRINPTARRRTPLLAVLAALALAAGAVHHVTYVVPVAGDDAAPVTAAIAEETFGAGENILVDDAAIRTQGEEPGPKVVKEFTRAEPFSMFALTWTGGHDIAAFFRGQNPDGTWTEWFPAERAEGNPFAPVQGTDPIYLSATTRVQVSTAGVDAGTPPADLKAVFIDGREDLGATPTDEAESGIALAATSDSYGMPRVISRKGWRADESLRCSSPTYDDGVSAIVIHHTAGKNDYSESQSASIVRGIYQYHAKSLGWCDIGYNALVDKYGNIFEGRYGGLNKAVEGAHAGGFNENTWGISMMGNYAEQQPSQATIDAVGKLAGWRAKVAGFDPMGYSTHYSEGTSYSKYAYGEEVTLPNIFAHRDVGNTTCPGDYGYAKMDTIRTIAEQAYLDSLGTGDDLSNLTNNAGKTDQAGKTGSGTSGKGDSENGASGDGAIEALSSLSSEDTPLYSKIITLLVLGVTIASIASQIDPNAPGIPVAIGDLTLSQVPAQGAPFAIHSDTPAAHAVQNITATYGDVLGAPRGDVQTLATALPAGVAGALPAGVAGAVPVADPVTDPVAGATDLGSNALLEFLPFERGILLLGGTLEQPLALWGKIGDAWAAQGFSAGPLGLPLNMEHADGNLIRVDFQGGYITFDPATGATEVHH